MNRFRNSYLGKSKDADVVEAKPSEADGASTLVREEPLTPPSLKVKRVDHYWSKKGWKYRVCRPSSPILHR